MYPFTIGDWEIILKYLRRDLESAENNAAYDASVLESGEREEMRETYLRWKQQADNEVTELKTVIKLIENRENC